MTAYVAAKYAEDNGWTFLYLKDVNDLAIAIQFAKMYGPSVIFAEDLDNALGTSQRNTDVNGILNTIDGVDTKDSEIIVVLTTNHVDRINKAMLRPGRLDAVINVMPPNGEAAVKLVHQYARGLLKTDDDFTNVSKLLNGKIPAVIREVVERAKLAAIAAAPTEDLIITAKALEIAAKSMSGQLALLTPQEPDDRSDIEKAADVLVTAFQKGTLTNIINEMGQDFKFLNADSQDDESTAE
jgi:transitional endoplasmic reticulum ATPase